MARGGKKEKECVTRFRPLLLALVFFSGCESLNEAVVRQMFRDPGLSRRMNYQIREGLEKRNKLPPGDIPNKPAPIFLDQG